ncbi:LamG-like jellyroll fold domain-containing protein [Pedobacter sp.]
MKTKLLLALGLVLGYVSQVKSQSGYNMVFNGTSNYITVSDHNDLDIAAGENYTVTCWIRTSQWKNMPVFRKRDPSGVGYEMTVGSGGAYAINMRSTTNVNTGSTVASYNMNLNQWYHLAMVVDVVEQNTKTYVNGVLQGTTYNAGIGTLTFENAVDLTIGRSVDQNRYFVGQMDDIRVWNKAFTPAELISDMTTTVVNSATANLLAAWDFENVVGTSVPDVSGKGRTGTIVGPVTLPVELLSFNANVVGNQVKLQWETASETNNGFFEVERSTDGKVFSSVVKINGAGNSQEKRAYTAIDERPLTGTSYYRLKQYDTDGKSTVYLPVSVRVLGNNAPSLYPNPATNYILVKNVGTDPTVFNVFDLNGIKQTVTFKLNDDGLFVDVSKLKSGLYFLRNGSTKSNSVVHKFQVK